MIKFNLIVSLLILPIMATDIAAQARFTPKELPYAYDALAPQVSEETLRFHHDKHYVGYVNKLNELILDTPYAQQPLEDIVVSADGAIFNNAAQMWNHEFFFDQLSPDGEARPTGALLKAIDADFGSFEQFKAQMEKAAVGLFAVRLRLRRAEYRRGQAGSGQKSPALQRRHVAVHQRVRVLFQLLPRRSAGRDLCQ